MHDHQDEKTDRLLSKILNGSASSGDIEFFAEWIKDLSNERYFEQYKEMWHVANDVEVSKEHLESSLSIFLSYIRRKRRDKMARRRVLYSISAASVILFIGLFFLNERYNLLNTGKEETFADLAFCRDSIKVELSDGSVVNPINNTIPGFSVNPVNHREMSYADNEQVKQTKKDSVRYNSVTIPAGERFAVVLSDGTKVYLNSNSYIRYPVNFSGDTRDVTLVGRAYFDVAKSKIPFIVNTSDMKVEVLGTSFDVESRKNGKSTSVILVEGSVKVLADGQSRIISPDEKLSIDRFKRNISVTSVDAKTLTLWKDGVLVLKDNTFDEMIEAICSWYGVEIVDNSSVPETERFNGRFDRENIATAIETIALSAKVGYRIEDGKLIIEDLKNKE
ncbi:MAG: FecR domain-containing protein [Bacteroidales bacterium]|nr:FecR domain-containing protein [Bacteroidales bacterium]